MLIYNRIY